MSREMRIDALLSRYGYCSRSEAREWVKAGRIRVHDGKVTSVSAKALPHAVAVDGNPIEFPDGIFLLMNKPAGYVCSHDSSEGPRVYDILPAQWLRRNPPITTIGRLDKESTGALLITDLGALVHRLTSPKHKVTKVYEVTVSTDLPASLPSIFASGTLMLDSDDKPCLPAIVNIHNSREASIEIVEGRYHQIRRMFASQGCHVVRLHRSRVGNFQVDDLPAGKWRHLPIT